MATRGQYEFGPYHLDADGHALFRNGERVPLTPKTLDVLITLVAAQGNAVAKDDLLRAVWPTTIVEQGNLTSHISQLRKAFAEHGAQQFIETLPKRGYRFVGPLKSVERMSNEAIAGRVMLVVLPFENLTQGEEKHDYFSDGLTEEMITQLARLSPGQLGVIARTSSRAYEEHNPDLIEVTRESTLQSLHGNSKFRELTRRIGWLG
jgi:DNA-binding winged helix-turn-helix (wHTH) protein